MLEEYLSKHFNFKEFRPGQREVVEAVMAGRDVVALMPTGGGKSLCFQLPAIVSNQLSVVISPLIALMKDQVDGLQARGIGASFINSSLSSSQISERMAAVSRGQTKILYIAPERFSSGGFRDWFSELDVKLVAVDEAHCVSQWGHDFRPDYLLIKDYIESLRKRPTVAAFTATATPEVKQDIIRRLDLRRPAVFVRGFNRPNLKFFVQTDLSKNQRPHEALRIIKSLSGSGIVYAITRSNTEELAEFFRSHGVAATHYHAGMKADERTRVQNEFMENRFKVIVATIAFGMGVDKADVRFVIHVGMPSSLEGYYQEAGRAGRDGETAYCVLLYSDADKGLHHFFIQKSRAEMIEQGKPWKEIKRVLAVKYRQLESIMNYALSGGCRRKKILEYFDDPELKNFGENCQGCDACLDFSWSRQKAETEVKMAEEEVKKRESALSDTVLETVDLYQKGMFPEQIASVRSLGVSTIFGHLVRWYLAGGGFEIDKYVSADEQAQILLAMGKIQGDLFLGAIKEKLPAEIGYEKIRLVVAKVKKMRI